MVDHNGIDSLLHGPNSKWFAIGGVAVAALVFHEYRKARLNAATAVPTATDSGTGYADTGIADTGSAYGYGSDTAGLFGYTDPASGTIISGAGGSTLLAGPSTNSQWSQQVQGMLVQAGYSSVDVAAAVGHYLVGTTMTAQQWEIVQAGIALEGQPPQGAPAPHIVPAGGGSGTPTPSAPADGYYQEIPSLTVYQVRSGRVFGVSPKTWAAMHPKPALKTITSNDPVLKLPYGGNI